MSIHYKALNLLSRREHSRRELKQKLLQRGFAAADIEPALTQLETDNLLSDDRFIACFIRSRLHKGQGPLKICAQLQNHGIDPTRIFTNEEWVNVDWQKEAVAVRIKRFGMLVPSSKEAQAKQARFLQQRGFTGDQIRKAFKSIIE